MAGALLRVLVVDDHAIVRRGLREILEEQLTGPVVGEAESCQQALAQIDERGWDVVIADLSLPDRSGLDLLAEIRRRGLRLPVLVLSVHPEDQFALRALRAGAAGYLEKDAAPRELVAAVEKVAAGGRYLTPSVAERLADALAEPQARAPHEALSNREFEVLRLIASGKTVGDIAEQMGLSVKTVSTYRTRLLEKMGMSTNAELTRYAIKNGLVD